MKQIVILGNSVATVPIIEKIRSTDSESAIALFASDEQYPYARTRFAKFLAGDIPQGQVFCRTKDFYEKNNVTLMTQQTLSRINLKKKRLFTEQKGQFGFDVLVLADLPSRGFSVIKGGNKAGVYGMTRFSDIVEIKKDLPFFESVAIQAADFAGFDLACAFSRKNKEVVLILPPGHFLSGVFSAERQQWFIEQCAKQGMTVVFDKHIAEILGDSDAKAVRVEAGKIYSSQVVLLDINDADMRLLDDGSLDIVETRIRVDERCRSGSDSVFAVDRICAYPTSGGRGSDEALIAAQGAVVGAQIVDGDVPSVCPLPSRQTALVEGLQVSVVGSICTEGVMKEHFDAQTGVYKAFCIQQDLLVGAVVINAEKDCDKYLRFIAEKGNLNTDEEFGACGLQPTVAMPSASPVGPEMTPETEGPLRVDRVEP